MENVPDASLHLIRGLVRKGDGKHRFRPHLKVFNQMRHAISDDSSLTAARAGEYEDRSFRSFDGPKLFRVEKFR